MKYITPYKNPHAPHDVVPLSTISAICPKVIHGHQHVIQQLETSLKQSQRLVDQGPSDELAETGMPGTGWPSYGGVVDGGGGGG